MLFYETDLIYSEFTAPVRKGRNNRYSAGCDEGKAFPLIVVVIYLYLEKLNEELYFKSNAIQYAGDWDGFASSMSSFDTWSGVITSGAGSLVTNSLNLATIGDNGVKVTGFSSMNVSDMRQLNGVIGSLATNGLEYAINGETTFNILNIADFGINALIDKKFGTPNGPKANASVGLLEINIGKNGLKTRLGSGGTNMSVTTVASAVRGFDALNTNIAINHYTNKNDLQNAAIALREQYGFGGKAEKNQLKSILNGKTELKVGSGPGNAQTILENGKRTVYLNGYKKDMTREEQLKLGITLGHEAYRDGVKGDELTQKIETRNAVAGHTDLMAGMLADDMYKSMMSGIIAGDTNLQMDLLARSLGDDVFNDYVDGVYDSSADYWRVLNNGDLLDDGLDDRVSFEDGRETIYYGKRSKQGTLEKFLGIKATEGYKTLLKDAGYSFNDGWSVNGESTIGTVISRESIENQIAAGKITNTQYYTPPNLIESGINSVKNTISSIFGDAKERQILKEKQKEKIEDPKYQQGSKGPKNFEGATSETTWCNMSTLEITFDTCYELSMALRNENDIYGENTNANAMYDNLAKAAAKEGSRIVEITTPEMAQKLANKGYTVVGSWKNPNPEKSGHIATVESGHKYNANEGPYFGNVGDKRFTGTNQSAFYAFGKYNYSNVKYYYCPTQFSRRRAL